MILRLKTGVPGALVIGNLLHKAPCRTCGIALHFADSSEISRILDHLEGYRLHKAYVLIRNSFFICSPEKLAFLPNNRAPDTRILVLLNPWMVDSDPSTICSVFG